MAASAEIMKAIFCKNKEEHPEPLKAEVQGEIPRWMEGTLIRNGPGMHTIGESKYNHWFDGMALLHSFTIKNGEVFYRSKYLRSDTYNCNMEADRIVVSEFGTMAYPDPCKNVFAKAFCYLSHTIPEFTDNCLIGIMKNGEDYYATSEVNFLRKIDPQSLETLEKVDYKKYMAINLVTAHPHYDSAGNIFNIGTSIVDKGKTKYVFFKIPPSAPANEKNKKKAGWKCLEVICTIPSRSLFHPSYYHSFGISENYILFLEQPFKLDILKMATAYIRGVNWASCIAFNKDDKTWIHLIDKRTKKEVSAKFCADAMIVFHHVNAYEEEDHMVFDVITYADGSLHQMFYLKNLEGHFDNNVKLSCIPVCKRFVLPLQYDKIIKFDTLTKKSSYWEEEHCWPSEPVFVPCPNAKEEDDGIIMSTIVTVEPQKPAFLLILDAKTFKEIARAMVNVELHLDLHGIFIPKEDLKAEHETDLHKQHE
ncbi:beta,beta-carotene 15,15'-dioxygenase isoform X4 [Varanus komodoensis]|uniref:beta,beta-carotene 15,15'-dioxygenase isoform X4 n=1 Tax=Varanus komodoensis TaxID=61221 RepID=UPI001CF7A4F2|nr:beta,beta-carotene 15,15'-dioxygenase isoform X4 [Varanus komodoensis]